MNNKVFHISNFERATAEPVDPKKLKYKGGRKVKYKGDTYSISKPTRATQKGKKYQVDVQNLNTGQKKKIAWGALGYDDYYVHKDKKRRQNFLTRHKAIKQKDGTPAYQNPFKKAYHAVHGNW